MAKKSAIARNKKRIRMVEKYSEIRNELKDIANSSKTSFEEKMEIDPSFESRTSMDESTAFDRMNNDEFSGFSETFYKTRI